MGIYDSFLSVTGKIASTAKRFAHPVVNGVIAVAERVATAGKALSIIPAVATLASTAVAISTAVIAVGRVVSDMLPKTPPDPVDVPDIIVDHDEVMDEALFDITPKPVTFYKPQVEPPMEYNGRVLARPRGRLGPPRLELDVPDIDMMEDDTIPYDRPEGRAPKRVNRFKPLSVYETPDITFTGASDVGQAAIMSMRSSLSVRG